MRTVQMGYADTALPQSTDVDTLYDSTTQAGGLLAAIGAQSFFWSIYSSHATTVKGYHSSDRGATKHLFYEASVVPGADGQPQRDAVPIAGYRDVIFQTVSGGNQTTYDVELAIEEDF